MGEFCDSPICRRPDAHPKGLGRVSEVEFICKDSRSGTAARSSIRQGSIESDRRTKNGRFRNRRSAV